MAKKMTSSLRPIDEIMTVWDVLTPDERQFLRTNYTVHHFKKNEMIQIEGEIPTHMMVLESGKAKVYKEGVGSRAQIIRMLKPGEHFGYRAIIASEPYNTNVSAFEASTVYMIKADIFISILKNNNAFCYRFLEEMATDLGASDARTVNLTQKHIRGRLAEALLMLKNRYGMEEDGATISIYLSREDLANLSNMTTSNAIRTLSNFVNEHIIAMDGRKLKIIDEEQLIRISKMG
ncbi:MAG: Crp/Fnr family transcriptional regulator [Paludibacter sp. 47-17]|nr:MAG: Crp/Fnr family transcriptional regulator [Pseudorhodoplanes sp.]OJX88557.1 MAG: Crp/Fnr family transcriptional regulator [Paludibacter sp. 47-17]